MRDTTLPGSRCIYLKGHKFVNSRFTRQNLWHFYAVFMFSHKTVSIELPLSVIVKNNF